MTDDEYMTGAERMTWAIAWINVTAFASLIYLGAGLVPSIVAVVFLSVSCALGLGRRWLLRGALALSVFAVLVLLGLPMPRAWPAIAKSLSSSIGDWHVEVVKNHPE